MGNFELHDSDSKIVSDFVKIEKELSWEEVLKLCNSGNRNSGDRNSGDGNSGNRNSGLFNTNEPFLRIFNKNTKLKFNDWYNHSAYSIINRMELISFIGYDLMTEQEQKDHPEYKTIGGYLKVNGYKEAWKIWYNKVTKEEIDIVKTIPNFSSKLFEEITGVKI